MDKRLFGSILCVLVLLGLLWVFAVNDIDTSYVESNVTGSWTNPGPNWTAYWGDNTSATDQITLNFTFRPTFADLSNKDHYNITNISIAFESGLFNFSLNNSNYESGNMTNFGNLTACGIVSDEDGVECIARRPYNLTGNKTFWVLFDILANKSTGTEELYNIIATVVANDSDAAGNRISDSTTFQWGVDDLKPRLNAINISDSSGNILRQDKSGLDGLNNSGYLKNGTNIIINISISEYNRNNGGVWLLWNVSSAMAKPDIATGIAGTEVDPVGVGKVGGRLNMTVSSCNWKDTTTQTCLYGIIINNENAGNFSDANVTSFVLWINDTFNHPNIENNSGKGYNFTLDGDSPSSTITMPNDITINAQNSITIKCSGADTTSEVNKFKITITSPSGRTASKTIAHSSEAEAKFEASDTGGLGEYTVDCSVWDVVGHETEAAQQTFRVYAKTVAGVAAPPALEKAKIDISREEAATGAISGKQGESSTFTLDGETIHRLTFLTVGLNTVTLQIESDPLEVTLSIGESKEVDVDADGVNDLEVLLKSIEDGKAEVAVTNLVALPAEEEVVEEEEVIGPPVEAPSKAGWWIALIVVLVIVIGYFVLRKKPKKKGKRGEVKFTKKDLAK